MDALPLWARAAQALPDGPIAHRTDFLNVAHLRDPRVLGSMIALAIEELTRERGVDLTTLRITVEPERGSFHRITTQANVKEG